MLVDLEYCGLRIEKPPHRTGLLWIVYVDLEVAPRGCGSCLEPCPLWCLCTLGHCVWAVQHSDTDGACGLCFGETEMMLGALSGLWRSRKMKKWSRGSDTSKASTRSKRKQDTNKDFCGPGIVSFIQLRRSENYCTFVCVRCETWEVRTFQLMCMQFAVW